MRDAQHARIPVLQKTKSVVCEAQTRQKWLKKRSLHKVGEHFEDIFNEVSASTIGFRRIWGRSGFDVGSKTRGACRDGSESR